VHAGNCEYITCQATDPCDDDDGGGGGGGGGGGIAPAAPVIPVTAAVETTQEQLIVPVTAAEETTIIPVTGVDLGFDFLALKQAFLFSGTLLFGISLPLEGISRKVRI